MPNYSLSASTHFKDITSSLSKIKFTMDFTDRLYIVSGKGGVGKTTISLSLSIYLQKKFPLRRISYINYNHDSLASNMCQNLSINELKMDTLKSSQIYLAQKFNSTIIAKWIMKTPFFKSVFQIIPSLSDMIFLGHIIDILKEDPSLIVVVDSPSTGHLLTMLESPFNFKEMFKLGLIVKDIDKMVAFSQGPNGMNIIICLLPTEMAYQESLDILKDLERFGLKEKSQLLINDVIQTENFDLLPPFLLKKIQHQYHIVDLAHAPYLAHIPLLENENVIKQMAHNFENLEREIKK